MLACALKIAPIALPTPGAVWRFTSVGRPRRLRVPVGHAHDHGLLQAEHVLKSSGKASSIGSSVEPGLPNMVVIPWERNSS